MRQTGVAPLAHALEIVPCRRSQTHLAEVIHDSKWINVIVILWNYIFDPDSIGLPALDQKWIWRSIFGCVGILLHKVIPVATEECIQ